MLWREENGGTARPGARSAERAILFLRVTPRLDGTIRVDADVYHDGGFRASQEDDLPVGEERFTQVDRIADELTDAVAALYPGFGRIRFTNTGYPASYVVRVDERTLSGAISTRSICRSDHMKSKFVAVTIGFPIRSVAARLLLVMTILLKSPLRWIRTHRLCRGTCDSSIHPNGGE